MLFQSVVGMWKNIESNHVNQAFCLLLRLDLQHLHMTHPVTWNNMYNHRKHSPLRASTTLSFSLYTLRMLLMLLETK